MFVNTDTWLIYCFECGADIYLDSHKKLYEAVEFIKKTNTKPNKTNTKPALSSMSLPKLPGKDGKDQANVVVQAGILPKETNQNKIILFNGLQ